MSSNSKGAEFPVAVVGIALELPSGSFSEQNLDYNSFWEFLLQKRDAYESAPEERLQGLVPGFSVDGTFLKGLTKFDNVEFGIGNKAAKCFPTTTRKLTELSFRAMLDSGINYRGKRFGSFMCGSTTETFKPDGPERGTPDSDAFAMANRMSYLLDITGPSFYVDTACSSSLTAMHLALQAIQNGECEGAIVGGCQVNANLFHWDSYVESGVTSPDNISRPFDAGANGFSKAEGAVVVVLKPLEEALADNDEIYSVILGSSINSNGAGAPLHVPSGVALQKCIQDAFAKAGRDPTEVDFVELHATGTPVGDPVEANASGEVFSREEPVFIGSVKGNTGHVESTAFLTSLVKVCLMLKHNVIPPNAHFTEPNPWILWDKFRLRVATEAIPLGSRSETGRSLIAVSSSGIGGSNGHVVFEAPPSPPHISTTVSPETPVLFVIGGLSPKTVQSLSDSVVQMLTKESSSEALSQAVTHARRARQLPWRTHFIYYPGLAPFPDIPSPVLAPKVSPPIVMVFSGQGPQHIHMGRSLFRTYKVFRDSILELDEIHEGLTGVSLITSTGLFSGDKSNLSGIWPTDVTLPALTMVQIALFDLLQSIGVKPDALFGHSAGEIALLYASGAASKAMTLEIAIPRASIMRMAEITGGGMFALACDLGTTERIIATVKDSLEGVLEIACYNAPEAFVVSGHIKLVEAALALAKQEGRFARRIRSSTPAHSSIMGVCEQQYLLMLEEIFSRHPRPCKPTIPTFSSVAGQEEMISEFTPHYLCQNMRRPVHFQQAVEAVLEDYPGAHFVEISPHTALSPYILALADVNVVCPMQRDRDDSNSSLDLVAFAKAIAAMFTSGINTIDLTTLYGRANRDQVYEIPYPFTERHFPLRIEGPRNDGFSHLDTSALRVKMNVKLFPDLAQHVILGESILPATAFLDLVLQTGAQALWDVEFNSILSLQSEAPIHVRVQQAQSQWTLVTGHGSDTQVHSKGWCSTGTSSGALPIDLAEIRGRLDQIPLQGFYDALLPLAKFGPIFQRIEYLAGSDTEWFAQINTEIEAPREARYRLNPVILDACVHFVLHPTICQPPNNKTIFLPHKLKRLTCHDSPTAVVVGLLYSHVTLVDWTPETRVYDINIHNASGTCICTMHRMVMQQIAIPMRNVVEKRNQLIYQPVVIDISIKPLTEVLDIYDADQELFAYWLDQVAQDAVAKALDGNPSIGAEIDRKRFHSWAKDVVTRKLPAVPLSAEVDRLKLGWPESVQATKSLSVIYAQTFTSSAPALDALFSRHFIAALHEENNKGLLEYTSRAFAEIIARMSSRGKRTLRVLEAGAGTGTLTNRLTDVLSDNPDVVTEYFATDVSIATASEVTSNCSYPRIIPKAYDLSKPLEDQEITPGSIDIVTSFLTLHASPNISTALDSLYKLLTPGGCLLVVELDGDLWDTNASPERRAGSLWYDFMFGCLTEWHGATDSRNHCAMTPQQWKSALEISGFRNVQLAVDKIRGTGFTFSAQKPHEVSLNVIEQPDASFFTFKYGEEILLQQHLYEMDVNRPLTLWLLASEGIDGDAASGITPTIALEFSHWTICAAVFPTSVSSESERIRAVLRSWDYIAHEQLVRFDCDGNAFVAKTVSLMPPPAGSTVFDPNGDWISDGTTIKEIVLRPLSDREVRLDVLAWSKERSSWRGFVGTVTESRVSWVAPGSHFVGIARNGHISNRINSSIDMIAQIDKLDASLAEEALSMAIAALALGPARLADYGREASPLHILLPHPTELNQLTANFFNHPALNTRVSLFPPSKDEEFALIVVDSANAAAHSELRSWLIQKTGKLFIWDTVLQGHSENEPWNIGFALKSGVKLRDSAHRLDMEVIRPIELKKSLPLVASQLPLFKAEKAYIIFGGASDLGVHISLWMYTNGARHIFLTSRRGSAFFDTSASITTKHKISYLQNRHDLHLQLNDFDATSAEAMSIFAQSIKLPVGGCFIATLVMHDSLFMNQKTDTFHLVSDLKLNVFKAFTSAFDINNVDFLIALTSMITLLGNPGQSSYAVGNAIIDGALSKYSNAFSIMLPAISGLGFLHRMEPGTHSVKIDDSDGYFTPDEICALIGDALLKFNRGDRFPNYIPDVSWNFVEAAIGLHPTARHLVLRNQPLQLVSQDGQGSMEEILEIILKTLDVAKSDFSPNQSFTYFGLDSFGATKISYALRPHVSVSQMQLLGGITWEQILDRAKEEKSHK